MKTKKPVTEADKLAWLRNRMHQERPGLPTKAQTAEAWRSLILGQMCAEPGSVSRIVDVGVWALITAIDVDVIEDIIRHIAQYGVCDDDDSGGSGDGEDVGGRRIGGSASVWCLSRNGSDASVSSGQNPTLEGPGTKP